MESLHDKILNDCSKDIIEKVDLCYLLPHLIKKRLVTDEEYKNLQDSSKASFEKNSQFHLILKTKGHRAFSLFLEALSEEKKHSGHKELCSKLSQLEKQPVPKQKAHSESRRLPEVGMVSFAPPTAVRESRSDSYDSSTSTSSSRTLLPTLPKSSGSILLDKYLELLNSQFSNQFNKFAVEITEKIRDIEKKVEAQCVRSSQMPWRLTPQMSSVSSQSSDQSSFVFDKSYDNIETTHVRSKTSTKRFTKKVSQQLSSSDEASQNVHTLPAIKPARKQQQPGKEVLPPLTKSATAEITQRRGLACNLYDTDFEIVCGCHSTQQLPLIQDGKVYLIVQGSSDVIKTYNLFDCQESTKRICDRVHRKKDTCPAMLFYCDKVALFGGEYNTVTKTFTLGLYQLDIKNDHAKWESAIPRSEFSSSQLDLKNSVPLYHTDGGHGLIMVSVLNPVLPTASTGVTFHVFSQTKTAGKNWKIAQMFIPGTTNCKIQSCVKALDSIYCSFLQQERGAYIYQISLQQLSKEADRKHKKKATYHDIKPERKWFLKLPTLQSCFLAVLNNGEIVVISLKKDDDKSILEIKRPVLFSNINTSPVEYHCEFPSVVSIVTASVVPGILNDTIVVIYHDSITERCCIKRIIC